MECYSDPLTGNYSCGPCPGGMTGDGVDCFVTSCDDVPEESRPKCEFECEMSGTGQPTCVCPPGYQLAHDNMNCEGAVPLFIFCLCSNPTSFYPTWKTDRLSVGVFSCVSSNRSTPSIFK